jgi:hypothetical protein
MVTIDPILRRRGIMMQRLQRDQALPCNPYRGWAEKETDEWRSTILASIENDQGRIRDCPQRAAHHGLSL